MGLGMEANNTQGPFAHPEPFISGHLMQYTFFYRFGHQLQMILRPDDQGGGRTSFQMNNKQIRLLKSPIRQGEISPQIDTREEACYPVKPNKYLNYTITDCQRFIFIFELFRNQ